LIAERGECNQVGPARQLVGVLLGRHDSQDLVDEAGHVRPRPAGAQQGDIHHQVEPDRPRHSQPQHEPHTGQVHKIISH
jgi:hypothetical protein